MFEAILLAYGLFSVLMVFSLRKENAKIQIFFYTVYMLYAIGFFSVFSVLVILANEDIAAKDFLWVIEKIVFYFAIVVVQHFVYKIGGVGKNDDLKTINV
ncbi:MAG: hypothetical protein K2N85_16520, partial [Lachnospiraceae bacterium]|nr:hypothetical protein [Lachnospiraceae bacterium]